MASRCEKTSGLATTVPSPGAVRPRFRERQVLRAADLETQQAYLTAARRRHNIGQHGWGIVQGLEIRDTPELVVQPGMAVDGYGRELIVTLPMTIPSSVFTELGDDTLDVWLVYQLVDVNVPQRGSRSCGPGKNTRTREQITTVRLTQSPQNQQRLPAEVPREPIEVPDADLPFLPHRTPPDDPEMEWPVYLGTIRQVAAPPYDPNSPRPYATLTGQVVTPASGLARMQIDAELQSDKRQFAVTVADSSGKLVERLGIDREGNTYITGNTTVKIVVDPKDDDKDGILNVDHDVHLSPADLGRGPAGLLNFRPLAATPTAAAPWQIYRTSVKENNATIRQLRFEFFHPGDKGEPTSYRFVVGTRNPSVFSPCLSLTADCTLTIAGNLTIDGQLVEGPIQTDPADPRFSSLVTQFWKVGEVAATTGTIIGTVTNTAGGVLSNVSVVLANTEGFTTTVATDLAGHYVALGIPIGDYTISASALGFDPATADRTLPASELLNVPFVLSPIPPIQGTVRDTNTAVVPGAMVQFTHPTSGPAGSVITNDAGFFTFAPLTRGIYSVLVTAPGFTPQTVTAEPGDELNIVLQTPPQPASIIGSVSQADETPISGATVEFTNTGTGDVTPTTTGESGIFTSGPLPPGTYSVLVTAAGFLPETRTAEPGDGLNIIMQPAPQPVTLIRGNVIDQNGAAVPAAQVEFRNQATGALSQTTTDESGSFRSQMLDPGTYEVRVSAQGFITQIVTATAGQTVPITLQPAIV